MKKNNYLLLYILYFLHFISANLIAAETFNALDLCRAKKPKHPALVWGITHIFVNFIPLPEKNVRPYKQNIFAVRNSQGNNLLHIACKANDIPAVKELFGRSFNPNEINTKGKTALHIACKKGNIQLVGLLLSNPKININKQTQSKKTALYIALENNFLTIAQLLYHHPECEINGSENLLHIVCKKNYHLILKDFLKEITFIQNSHTFGLNPLAIACIYNSVESAKLLILSFSAFINQRAIDGSTPLHNAIENDNTQMVQLLLTHIKTDPNLQDYFGNNKILKLLPTDIEAGFNLEDDLETTTNNNNNNKDEEILHNTALHIACIKNNTTIVKLLLNYTHPLSSYSIDPNIKNAYNLTPLNIALQNNNHIIIDLLHEHNAKT
jgi:ankyrin repeat protein